MSLRSLDRHDLHAIMSLFTFEGARVARKDSYWKIVAS
jgi:hypothetical protein